MKIRQIALVAKELAPVRTQLFSLLGLKSDYPDPGVGHFGLENSVMTIGDTFLEVVAPMQANTTAERLLERRGGDGGYMVICQCDDFDMDNTRINSLGIRKVWETDIPDEVRAFHMHPKDVPGAICSFDEMTPAESWKWAGPGWEDRSAVNVSTICGAEMQATDPEKMASRWAEVFGHNFQFDGDTLSIVLGQTYIRFVEATDGRGDGLGGVDFTVRDWAAIRSAAESLDLRVTNRTIDACGTRLQFLDASDL